MRWVGGTLLLAILLAAAVATWRSRYAIIKWDYDYARNPPCSTEVVKGQRPDRMCVLGFYVFRGGIAKREEQQFIANSFQPNGAIIDKAIQGKLRVRGPGNVLFCVTSLAKDGNGRLVESDATCKEQLVVPWNLGR